MEKQGLTKDEIDAKVEYLFRHSFNYTLHAYIDITGDLIAGTLLSQIMYWFSEGKNNGIKAGIYKDGHYWIAKRREDWMQEIRISKKQYDRAIKKLTCRGMELVEVRKYRFDGSQTTHIRPITENIDKKVAEWKNNLAQSLAQDNVGCSGNFPKGKSELLQQVTDSAPKGKSELPQQVTDSAPKGKSELSQQVTDNTPKGKSELPQQVTDSAPKGKSELPQTGNSYNVYNNIYNTTETTTKTTTETTYKEKDLDILSGKPDEIYSSASDSKPKSKFKNCLEDIKQIIDYFNRKCNTNYQYYTKATTKLIKERLNEDFTVDDFFRVIDIKHAEWANDRKFCKYLRPQTLFSELHFENYLNQISSPVSSPESEYGAYSVEDWANLENMVLAN